MFKNVENLKILLIFIGLILLFILNLLWDDSDSERQKKKKKKCSF